MDVVASPRLTHGPARRIGRGGHARAAAVIVAAVVAVAAAGCHKHEAAPRKRLVIATTAEPDTLCALASNSGAAQEVIALLSRELVVEDPSWRTIPDLATEVPKARVVDGKLVVTWHIKKDAAWEDGAPVTAADFVLGLAHDERSDAKRIESLVPSADGRSFTVTWRDENPFYAATRVHRPLPSHVAAVAALAKGALRDSAYCRKPLSNGPFRLVEWVPGEHLLFARNERFRPRPALDEVLVQIVPSTTGILTRLAAGDVDAAFPSGGPSPVEAKRFAGGHPGFAVDKAPGQVWAHIDLNVDDPALADAAVRRALAAALPRAQMVGAVYDGMYDVAETYIPPRHWAHAELPPIAYDPAGAKEVLAPKKLHLTLSSASGQPQSESLLLLAKDAWKKAGVDVDLDLRPFKVFFGDTARKRKTQMAFYAWTIDSTSFGGGLWRKDRIPSEENGFTGQNFPGFHSDEATTLLDKADVTLDQDQRVALIARVQKIVRDEMPAIPIYFRPVVALHRAGVTGLAPTGTLTPLAWNAAAWDVSP